MKKYFTIMLVIALQSCHGSTYQSKGDENYIENDSLKVTTDSLSLLNSLYSDVGIMNNSLIDHGIFTHKKDTQTQKVFASVRFSDLNLSYNIVFKDTLDIYSEKNFMPSEDYAYVDSYIVLEKDTVRFMNAKSFNDSTTIEPVNMWYGSDFGIQGKLFKTKQQVILLRGLNMFCNGSFCSNYKIMVIVKGKNSSYAYYFNTSAIFPFDFENTFLVNTKTDTRPSFFIIKSSLSIIKSKKDFESFVIEENGVISKN